MINHPSLKEFKGLRILNTRPLDQGNVLNIKIKQQGGIPVHCPALVIEPLLKSTWLSTLPNLETIKTILFTSHNAVDYFFSAIYAHGITLPSQASYIAIGQATAHTLAEYGYQVMVPQQADSEHLLLLPQLQKIQQTNILLIKGQGGRSLIEETLRQRGAQVHVIEVYRRTMPKALRRQITHLWQKNGIDGIIYTSAEGMKNILTCSPKAHDWLLCKPSLVISERLAAIARQMGIHHIIHSSESSWVSSLMHLTRLISL